MKLEIGKHYLTASGQIIEIDYKANKIYYAKDSGIEYYDNGRFWNDDSDSSLDLIAEIPKELHWYVVSSILDYNTSKAFKDRADTLFKIFKSSNVAKEITEQFKKELGQ